MMNEAIQVRDAAHFIRYGCVFCKTGREEAVVESLEAQNPGLSASYVSQIKRKTVQGITSTVQQITMPGYVYFQTNSFDPPYLKYVEDAIRLVRPSAGSWALMGMDAWFAKWVFENHGVIRFSKARLVDNRVQIMGGPLKDLEDCIVRIVKRERCAQVLLPFLDREVRIWLAFEYQE